MKKNVYLIQPSNMLSNSTFLPYAVGCLAAYSFSKEEICKEYNLCDFIYTKVPIDECLEIIDAPFIVGFSCYMWNIEYNLALAKAVKEKWKNACIVFGGPQVPDDTTYLEEYDFIDVLMHAEGEISFYELLKALLADKGIENVSNISARFDGVPKQTYKQLYPDLSDFPSPYTAGLFDKIVNDPANEGIQFDTVLETTRGCPFNCTYCYWAGTGDNFRKFNIERAIGDIDWMAAHKTSYCFCADSNFGLLPRDAKFAEYIAATKEKYGYPIKFETTSTSKDFDTAFKIHKILNDEGLCRGISIAVQSLSPKVLEAVGRKNISYENFHHQLVEYKKHDIFTYTDLILGLPEDTLDSFLDSLFGVMEAGQHYNISVYRCLLIPNTQMYSNNSIEKYKIKTKRAVISQKHCVKLLDNKLGSCADIVVETSTMSSDEMLTAYKISILVKAFHCMGITRFIALYLRDARNISYRQFYVSLYDYILANDGYLKKNFVKAVQSADDFVELGTDLNYYDEQFGNTYWSFEEALFLLDVLDTDTLFKEINEFVATLTDLDETMENLFKFQKCSLATPGKSDFTETFLYNWCDYLNDLEAGDDAVLKKQNTVYLFSCHNTPADKKEYARQIVWRGRRFNKPLADISECTPNEQ